MHAFFAGHGLFVDFAALDLGNVASVLARMDVVADRGGVRFSADRTRLGPLLPVDDVRLGDLELLGAHERDFDGVLDLLDVGDVRAKRGGNERGDLLKRRLVDRTLRFDPCLANRALDLSNIEGLNRVAIALANGRRLYDGKVEQSVGSLHGQAPSVVRSRF